MVEIIAAVAVAVSGMAAAGFRYLTVRELAKRAKPEDIPAIAESVYQKRDLGPLRRDKKPGLPGLPDENT